MLLSAFKGKTVVKLSPTESFFKLFFYYDVTLKFGLDINTFWVTVSVFLYPDYVTLLNVCS